MWSAVDIAWMAGIVEGEGCLTATTAQRRLVVSMTDLDVIQRLHGLGVGNVYGPTTTVGDKELWSWSVSNIRELLRVVTAITPLMSSRRRGKLDELADLMHELTRHRTCVGCGDSFNPSENVTLVQSQKTYCTDRCKWRIQGQKKRTKMKAA